jgi:hypothetical protein
MWGKTQWVREKLTLKQISHIQNNDLLWKVKAKLVIQPRRCFLYLTRLSITTVDNVYIGQKARQVEKNRWEHIAHVIFEMLKRNMLLIFSFYVPRKWQTQKSSVFALNFPLTGEKCFTNFWNVESTLWKADNGKNSVCLSHFRMWFGFCWKSWSFEIFINQQNTWKYGLSDGTSLCKKNYCP